MGNRKPQLETLIHSLRDGPPRAAYHARQELVGFGRAAEVPLIHLLSEVNDAHRLLDVLLALREVKMSDPGSVDAVVRLLWRKEAFVRGAAAACLLAASPKLRRVLAPIRAAHAAENDQGVRATLRQLLDRCPRDAA